MNTSGLICSSAGTWTMRVETTTAATKAATDAGARSSRPIAYTAVPDHAEQGKRREPQERVVVPRQG